MSRTLQVLLVEDDAEDALLFMRRCPAGFRVRHVSSMTDALQALQTGGLDVCFTDYRLGLDTGLELVRSIRAQGLRLPVVVITGQDLELLGENALIAGATDFVPKEGLDTSAIERVARWAMIRRHVEDRGSAAGDLFLTDTESRRSSRAEQELASVSSLRRLVYLSRAHRRFSRQQVLGLCAAFAAANARADISGVLVHVGNRFMQVLEGRHEAVEQLMTRIRSDGRHGDLLVAVDEPIRARAFAQWSMGCLCADEQFELSPSQLMSLSARFNRVLEHASDPSSGLRELIRALPELLRESSMRSAA
ncbi:MAG: BLUF domain-containing protein [Panacagrimonas sp.]